MKTSKWRISRVCMRGSRIPGFVLSIIGFIHMKLNMIEKIGNDYFMTKSPYLLKIRHRYLEYTKKMHMKASELIQPLQTGLLEKEANKTILMNQKTALEAKERTLPEVPVSGNEIRAFIELQKAKDENVGAIAQMDAEITEIRDEIRDLQNHEIYCAERMLEVAITKAYSYIEGSQRAARTKSFYIRTEDFEKQLFEFVADNKRLAIEGGGI